ncbi:GyrI-like domain-containing protein [Streptosporangium sp. NPDC004379]|uniref:GyrI-like domain-containing protein n=1 Tax=Streptosporangium sp. NPDC004379 TaxID=3366189 RepID=UPI00369C8DBF
MIVVDRPESLVVGRAVRTSNAEEGEGRGRLAALWARVGVPGAFAHVPGRVDENVYAVYTDYESGHHGAYTVIVGVAVRSAAAMPEGMVAVRVPAVPCLKLEARGQMPETLRDAWQRLWKHTESGGTPPRAFTTDLEVHRPGGVDLYAAVFTSMG